MIYGVGVGAKYGTIVEGRKAELYARGSPTDPHIQQQLDQFITEVKNCSLPEFNMWYELYSSPRTTKKPKK